MTVSLTESSRMKSRLRFARPPGPEEEALLGRIADEVEAVTTARLAMTLVVRGRSGDVAADLDGFTDYRRHLTFTRLLGSDPVHLLQAGPDVLRRLSLEDQRETGKSWAWEEPACPKWESERAETVGSIRHRARILRSADERVDGEDVRRYTLLIRPRRRETDPLLAGVRDHFRLHGIKRLTYEVWLTRTGRLRRTREHAVMVRARRRLGSTISMTIDHRDFGIVVEEFVHPAPEDILRPDGGLAVIIDGRISPY
jgi:hypothetical protein